MKKQKGEISKKAKMREMCLKELAKIERRETERLMESILIRLPMVKDIKHVKILSDLLETILDGQAATAREAAERATRA